MIYAAIANHTMILIINFVFASWSNANPATFVIPNNSDVTYFVTNAAKQSVKTVGVTDAANATSMCVIDAHH